MKEQAQKYLFLVSSGLLFLFMLLMSSDAGITCDEVLHYDHSVAVYNYFASHGADKSALNTPVTNLKYYGQSYDNLVTILIKWFHIDNVYGFRHIMSSLAGWVTVMITAFFALWLSGYRTGIIVIVLFAVSPTFLGHSQNNLKDIPFALGYIASLYFIGKFLLYEGRIPMKILFGLIAGMAFSISIRAGGLLMICYFILFFTLFSLYRYFVKKKMELTEIRKKLLWILIISVVSWLMGILLWPYALQRPIRNVLESYHVMAHFPGTFMQIFEGREEWSDFMPWYYLIKSMAITIPLVAMAGFMIFFLFFKRVLNDGRAILYIFLLFTIFFPVGFVMYEKSNIYSSWRQFLFLYPSVILLAATGFSFLIDYFRKPGLLRWIIVVFIVFLSYHPVKFMAENHRYAYIYYNQLVGGLHGAYGNYETDYYYVSQTEASHWLMEYLKFKGNRDSVRIKATYSVDWLFRKHPEIETSYFRYQDRSMSDWDYAIAVSRYIPPFQLKNRIWPPGNAIHIIYADNVPICAVLERRTRDDLHGYEALNAGRTEEAVNYFEKALQVNNEDEMIFYNFARALYDGGQYFKADSVLRKGLELNPGFEPILMYMGNIARTQGRDEDAIINYQKVIRADRKYFEAYVALAELLAVNDLQRARELLRRCLEMNPAYRPAVMGLADTYRNSDPDIAKKYDELARSLK